MPVSAPLSPTPDVVVADQPLGAVGDVELLAVPVRPAVPGGSGLRLGPGAGDVAAVHRVDLSSVADEHKLSGRAGETAVHPLTGPVRQLVLVGVGDAEPADLRSAGAALARVARGRTAVATTVPAVAEEGTAGAGVQAFVEGLLLASFTLTWRTGGPERPPVARVVLCGVDGADEAVRRGLVVGRAGCAAREVATWPSRDKTPQWLADRASAMADDAGLDVRVWDEQALAAAGFEGILGVGRGSARPPRLIQLRYAPRGSRTRGHVVLVGKGITFDTGGLWLKPRDGMMTMKRDVTGGAVVLAVMAALRALDVPLRVTGLVAAAENSIGADAQRPGDVVRHPGGRTSEVVNTDAEGRLVLADALAYASRELRPDVLVDVATLTGAVRVALGRSLGGLFADDDALAEALLASGQRAGEPLWRLPLVDDYAPDIASDVADARNMGGADGGTSGGSIAAALFLRPFAGGVPWAHLDVASVGDAVSDAGVWTEGPTGFGARALLAWLSGPDPLAGVRQRRAGSTPSSAA